METSRRITRLAKTVKFSFTDVMVNTSEGRSYTAEGRSYTSEGRSYTSERHHVRPSTDLVNGGRLMDTVAKY